MAQEIITITAHGGEVPNSDERVKSPECFTPSPLEENTTSVSDSPSPPPLDKNTTSISDSATSALLEETSVVGGLTSV